MIATATYLLGLLVGALATLAYARGRDAVRRVQLDVARHAASELTAALDSAQRELAQMKVDRGWTGGRGQRWLS